MSSSSSSCNWRYDIFPSFRGEDVRRSFLSYFLKELDRKLISAFKDNKIEKGQTLDPVLKQAIQDSRIAIVVFSENYASSTWCLNELLEIVKCNNVSDQLVIPIFHNVDPSHVRKQSGDFGKIFKETCHNHNKTEVEILSWQNALTDMANLAGFDSKTWKNEAKLIEAIVNDILAKLSLTPSKAFDDFVGVADHIAKMTSLLHLESNEVRMVGIWGSSGIGKTTIARALFYRLSNQFQTRIFVDRAFISKIMVDYRGANTDDYNMKLSLQRNFLSEILGTSNIKVDHLGVVGDRLKNHKILIFIDDLDDQYVLEALAGESQWFGHWSRIIVITKDRHLLRAHKINHIYEVSLPSEELALEMLCRYAFKQNTPPRGFENLAVEVVWHAGSLPIGLNVLGSSLRGRDKEYWMEMMPRLRKSLDGKIEKTLRFSYDGMDSEDDKAIFRYIACIFHGMEINCIKLLLADSELSVNIGLQNLVDKSLISVSQNSVQMHCLLQEMGRKMVRAKSIDKPGEQEFLVNSKDICDVLHKSTGTRKVLGISLDIDEIVDLYVHESSFKGMCNLQSLNIYSRGWGKHKNEVRFHFDKSFDYLPPELKLLCWEKYPMRCLPSKFCPEKLVILKMMNTKLEKLWERALSLPCLKEMILVGSKDLTEIPDLSTATNLEQLDLRGCSSLTELPSTIGNLHKLIRLDMHKCINLETIPSGINLQSLGYLYFKGCSQLKSFPDISRNVIDLNLSDTAIEEVPWWVENFYGLKCLTMGSCSKLKYVSISTLKHLYRAEFYDCEALVGSGWNGYPSGVTMTTDKTDMDLPAPEEASSSLPDNSVPQVKVTLSNCINLDLEALLPQESVFKQLILSGEEVPLYFTHKAKGTSSSLTIPLLQTSFSQPFFRFRACAVIVLDPMPPDTGLVEVHIKINCRFKDRQGNNFDSPDHLEYILICNNDSHMFVFDCCFPLEEDYAHLAELNYDYVDIKFHFSDDIPSSKLREWGIRLLEDYSSTGEHSKELETRDSTPSPNNSSIFGDVGDEVNKRNTDSDTEEEHGRISKQIKVINHWSVRLLVFIFLVIFVLVILFPPCSIDFFG